VSILTWEWLCSAIARSGGNSAHVPELVFRYYFRGVPSCISNIFMMDASSSTKKKR